MLNHVGVDGTLEAMVLRAILVPGTARDTHGASRWAWLTVVCSGVGELLLDSLVGGWQEDDLAVGRLGHLLHGLKVSEDIVREHSVKVGKLATHT